MREKKHWERQIVALGGANYTRNTAMLDEDGKQVPGTRGYKCVGRPSSLWSWAAPTSPGLLGRSLTSSDLCSTRYFGRAKDLPGVKELFAKKGE